MYIRKDPLENNYYYHIFSRSIAKFVVFNDENDYSRMIEILDLYRFEEFKYGYAQFLRFKDQVRTTLIDGIKESDRVLVEIAAFCLMPTHIHLILKQTSKNGISRFMARVFNSYSRYFNIRHYRTGPLWEGRFKNVLVLKDEQLLHLTRYIHLNPTSAKLVSNPEDWSYSSHNEYIDEDLNDKMRFCKFKNIIIMSPKQYRQFVNDRKSYQQELSKIKNTLIDNNTS